MQSASRNVGADLGALTAQVACAHRAFRHPNLGWAGFSERSEVRYRQHQAIHRGTAILAPTPGLGSGLLAIYSASQAVPIASIAGQ